MIEESLNMKINLIISNTGTVKIGSSRICACSCGITAFCRRNGAGRKAANISPAAYTSTGIPRKFVHHSFLVSRALIPAVGSSGKASLCWQLTLGDHRWAVFGWTNCGGGYVRVLRVGLIVGWVVDAGSAVGIVIVVHSCINNKYLNYWLEWDRDTKEDQTDIYRK
jgi:hypothetical protein